MSDSGNLMKKLLGFVLVCFLCTLPLMAEVESVTTFGVDGAYYTDDHRGYDGDSFAVPDYTPVEIPDGYSLASGDAGRELGSGWGSAEAKAWLSHAIKVPFLAGDNPLTSGNNLNFKFLGSLSPVTADLEFKTVFTPIAMLQFELGSMIGSGWAAFGFNGMGLHQDASGEVTEDNLAGLVSKQWLSGTFQFDLAAVLPGEWNHIVTVASGKIQYQNYSRADNNEAWLWQADDGENFNGFRYYGTYLLGYQMPLKISTVGILIGTKEYIGDIRSSSTMDTGGWGSDYREIRIAPLMVVDLIETSDLTILFQFENERKYTDDTIFNKYFLNREYESTFWRFYRIAFSYALTL